MALAGWRLGVGGELGVASVRRQGGVRRTQSLIAPRGFKGGFGGFRSLVTRSNARKIKVTTKYFIHAMKKVARAESLIQVPCSSFVA